MIRVNLLPRRRETKRGEGGRAWIALLVVLALGLGVGIIIVDDTRPRVMRRRIGSSFQLTCLEMNSTGRVVASHE